MTVRNKVRPEEAAKAAHVHVRLARNGLDEGWLDYVEHHLTAADQLLGLAGGLESPVSPSREKEMEDLGDVYLLVDEAKKDAKEEPEPNTESDSVKESPEIVLCVQNETTDTIHIIGDTVRETSYTTRYYHSGFCGSWTYDTTKRPCDDTNMVYIPEKNLVEGYSTDVDLDLLCGTCYKAFLHQVKK